VTLRDSESNQLATGGQTVALSVTSGFGSIGTVTDNEDGTYTASYTSGTTVGTATISATLNTAAIAETQTITLVHGPATKVTITQQPATGASGTSLTTQPKVVLRDANNNIATSDSGSTVTVAITSGSNGSLTGTKTVTVVAGEAVFPDLSFAGIVGTDYKFRFSSGSLTVADSNNLRVTPGVAVVGTSTITASSSSITANGVSTSTITVQLKDAQGNSLTINDDAVSIRVDSGTGNVGSTLPAGNGTYTATFTSSTTAGTSTIRATLGGNARSDRLKSKTYDG
jgi:adhesin/invasin